VGREDRQHFGFSSFYCLLLLFHNRKSMFAVLHSDIVSKKSGLLHLTGQPYCKKSRSSKVKDGIINLILRNYLVDWYICLYADISINYAKKGLRGWVNKIFVLFSESACLTWGRIFSHVRPFCEWPVSYLDRSMHRSLWI
jgi:hypothetical protein